MGGKVIPVIPPQNSQIGIWGWRPNMGILKCATPVVDTTVLDHWPSNLNMRQNHPLGWLRKDRLLFTTASDSVTLGWPPSAQLVWILLVRTTHWEPLLQKDTSSIWYLSPWLFLVPHLPLFLWLQAADHWLIPGPDSHLTSPVFSLTALSWTWFYIHPPPPPSSSLNLTRPPPAHPAPSLRDPNLSSWCPHDQSFHWGCKASCKGKNVTAGRALNGCSHQGFLSQCYNTLRPFWLYSSYKMKAFEKRANHFWGLKICPFSALWTKSSSIYFEPHFLTHKIKGLD